MMRMGRKSQDNRKLTAKRLREYNEFVWEALKKCAGMEQLARLVSLGIRMMETEKGDDRPRNPWRTIQTKNIASQKGDKTR
jgi:hypothetical protein